MSATVSAAASRELSWREDLEASRDVGEREKPGYGFILSWLESWRLKEGQAPGREAAREFWRREVKTKQRKDWQLEQWAAGIRWYLHWLEICTKEGREPRGLREIRGRLVGWGVVETGAKGTRREPRPPVWGNVLGNHTQEIRNHRWLREHRSWTNGSFGRPHPQGEVTH